MDAAVPKTGASTPPNAAYKPIDAATTKQATAAAMELRAGRGLVVAALAPYAEFAADAALLPGDDDMKRSSNWVRKDCCFVFEVHSITVRQACALVSACQRLLAPVRRPGFLFCSPKNCDSDFTLPANPLK